MVKSVVKPLKMGFLQERIVPKKSVFTRAFSVFASEYLGGGVLLPKQARYHLRYIPKSKILT